MRLELVNIIVGWDDGSVRDGRMFIECERLFEKFWELFGSVEIVLVLLFYGIVYWVYGLFFEDGFYYVMGGL